MGILTAGNSTNLLELLICILVGIGGGVSEKKKKGNFSFLPDLKWASYCWKQNSSGRTSNLPSGIEGGVLSEKKKKGKYQP
ncbi:hypothetical protein CDAR_583361 [Caerostris darwini]|uniref:Secreted protein n=1 Tax=Caerostris darwini TaxID=1538125 RepID=A0AAV4VAL9_9ARAC|nr:hypothetical protein CDAR_583361 [Caerostris darwini]